MGTLAGTLRSGRCRRCAGVALGEVDRDAEGEREDQADDDEVAADARRARQAGAEHRPLCRDHLVMSRRMSGSSGGLGFVLLAHSSTSLVDGTITERTPFGRIRPGLTTTSSRTLFP